MHNLEKIIKDLLPLIDVGVSPITNQRFKGFSLRDGENGFSLVKIRGKSIMNAQKPRPKLLHHDR